MDLDPGLRKLHTSFNSNIDSFEHEQELSVVQKILADSCFHSSIGAQNTPKSISITRDQNKIIRMPDSAMMIQQRHQFYQFLMKVLQHPDDLVEAIRIRREEMVKGLAYLHSPATVNSGSAKDYEILGLMGKGRFASVYRCRNCEKQLFAMKVLDANMLSSKKRKYLANCEREVGLLKQLNHQNIIKYSGSFFSSEKLCIILELADTGDLQQVIRQCKTHNVYIAEKTIWGYQYQLCSGLQYLHHHRILHRDLKPSNVFVTANGCLKLGDLGLGRYLDWASVAAFSQVGTPLYMSPEVLRGDGYEFASDIWSLGCILYELAMLESPFYKEGLPLDKILNTIVRGQRTPLKQGVYSQQMHMMVESMLQTVPSKRPQIETLTEAAYFNSKFNISPICMDAENKKLSSSDSTPKPMNQPNSGDLQECVKKEGEMNGTISDQFDAVERFAGNNFPPNTLLPENQIIAPSNFERRTLDFNSDQSKKEKTFVTESENLNNSKKRESLKERGEQIKISPRIRVTRKTLLGSTVGAVPDNSPLILQHKKKLKAAHQYNDILADAHQRKYVF